MSSHVSGLLVTLVADALDEVEEEFARHCLDAARKRFVVDILREESDGKVKVAQGQVLTHVVHKVSECAVRERAAEY